MTESTVWVIVENIYDDTLIHAAVRGTREQADRIAQRFAPHPDAGAYPVELPFYDFAEEKERTP